MTRKKYEKPHMFVERFALTQMLTSCSVLIGLMDRDCILHDTDSSPNMKDYAVNGYFAAGYCDEHHTTIDAEDGVCYHTSINLVFAS